MATDLSSPIPPLAPWAFARWLWQLTKDVVHEYADDGVGDLGASITFWTILSIPAAILALVSALSSLDSVIGSSLASDVEADVQRYIADTLVDSEALARTVDELFNTSSPGVATLATIVALFTLSRAFAGLIRALDVAYEVDESRPFWYLRIVAIGLGVSTLVVVAGTATVLAILPSLPLGTFLRLLAAPIAVVVLIAWAATLFHLGPNHRTPWRYDLPGAIFTALGWIITSQGFAFYVSIAGSGNQVQTSVAAVLLALTLLYLFSLVMLIGAEINDVIARRSGVVEEIAPVTDRARTLRDRLRHRRPG